MDLTKYLKKDILYNDLGFSTGKSTHELINEMQAQGLLVDFLEITGEIIKQMIGTTVNASKISTAVEEISKRKLVGE